MSSDLNIQNKERQKKEKASSLQWPTNINFVQYLPFFTQPNQLRITDFYVSM